MEQQGTDGLAAASRLAGAERRSAERLPATARHTVPAEAVRLGGHGARAADDLPELGVQGYARHPRAASGQAAGAPQRAAGLEGSRELARSGRQVSADTVAGLLREEGFSLQADVTALEGGGHPDRDAQFRHLNEQVREHRDTGQPVISVDTRKKELVGKFKAGGRQWRPTGDPVLVGVHDFADPQLGKAVPYGIYDIGANTGWVNVGTDHDTAACAVESIRRWWHGQGHDAYPQATRLLITADTGGSERLPHPSLETSSWPGSPPRRGDDHRVSSAAPCSPRRLPCRSAPSSPRSCRTRSGPR